MVFLLFQVWLLITNKVLTKRSGNKDKYDDFEFFNNSSQYFRNLLQPKRVLALFEMVVWVAYPWILATTDDDKGTSSDSDSDSNWKTVDEDSDVDSIETSGEKLPEQNYVSVIKTCREVCTTWNKAVDQLIYEKYTHTHTHTHTHKKRIAFYRTKSPQKHGMRTIR